MNTRFLASLVVLVLVGCNSFNNWNVGTELQPRQPPPGTTTLSAPALTSREAAQTMETQQGSEMLCYVFTAPELPNIPPLPLAELARAPAGNPELIDAIQQRHIEDLRRHITETRRILREAYDKYLDECRARQRKTTAK